MHYPIGGVLVIYELANALAARGHEVHLGHIDIFGDRIRGLGEIGWFVFDPAVVHHFPDDGQTRPRADVIFANRGGLESRHLGLPAVLIQGWQMLDDLDERDAFRSSCPKVCVAQWLVDIGRDLGVPARELVYVPNGIRHDRYSVRVPIERRSPCVTFCYNAHPQKGATLALQSLELLKAAHPEVRAMAFGSATEPEHEFPEWVEYVSRPPVEALVRDVYNASTVFLCTSTVEGFGLPSVEAMACGAALVTTDNGGSHDYAIDGETALVVREFEPDAVAAAAARLLDDDARRIGIASRGAGYVRRFNWPRSAEMLEDFMLRYVDAPASFGYAAT